MPANIRNPNRRLSRYGCRNCKLRKIKCDEKKPSCEKCRSYGVACNFDYGVGDLQPLPQCESTEVILKRRPLTLLNSPRPPPGGSFVWSSNEHSRLDLNHYDQELFYRFQERTIKTFCMSPMRQACEKKILEDAFTHPSLMHGILAVVSAHDRYLSIERLQRRSIRESYHSYQCASLFGNWLSSSIQEKHKDAVWATAVLLSVLSFSSIDGACEGKIWPLGSNDTSALDWLRLKSNDQALWKIADPMRRESVFRRDMAGILRKKVDEELSTPSIADMPDEVLDLCGLEPSSVQQSDRHFWTASAICWLSKLPKHSPSSVYSMFNLLRHNVRDLQISLEQKDPAALLLLYLWYNRAHTCKWWIELRASYEAPAIMEYLKRYHADNKALQKCILTLRS